MRLPFLELVLLALVGLAPACADRVPQDSDAGADKTERFQTAEADVTEILGEELPDGSYRAAVYLAFVDGGQPEASAGEVELAR